MLIFCLLITSLSALAQGERKDKTAVTFEELYDEPYSVNRLFVGFQPFYGDVFATNVNAGYGIEASYYLKEKADFKAHLRKSYSSTFFDFTRELARRNANPGFDFTPEIYNYYELGGTYHAKDFDVSSKTKMTLYKNSYKGNKWAARVPLQAEVPCKLRKVYGVRLGGIMWNSTTDITRALDAQGLTNADLTTPEEVGLPLTYVDANNRTQNLSVFSNVNSAGVYLGGSMTWIRNVAVSFDKFEEGVDDGILTLFFDILYSPLLTVDPVVYQGSTYGTDALKLNMLGVRAGIDGKFNRQLSWGYGGEFGYRPSLDKRGFFAMFKISFPMYGTNIDYKVESFGK